MSPQKHLDSHKYAQNMRRRPADTQQGLFHTWPQWNHIFTVKHFAVCRFLEWLLITLLVHSRVPNKNWCPVSGLPPLLNFHHSVCHPRPSCFFGYHCAQNSPGALEEHKSTTKTQEVISGLTRRRLCRVLGGLRGLFQWDGVRGLKFLGLRGQC